MKNSTGVFLSFFLMILISNCTKKIAPAIMIKEVSPWCILGFDSLDRTPKQRIAMLQELGLSKYGYNKGKGHMEEMVEEFALAKANGIEIPSVFLWLNAKRDSIGKLSPANQELFANLKVVDYKPTIWVSFSGNFFKKLEQKESIAYAVEMIKFIKIEANKVGCELAIYNHHGWFGNPHHQIEILETLKDESITMVYNFHHAHEFVDEFPEIVKKIKPYLSYVNLNGVKEDGPQIMTIGAGEHELEMVKLLLKEGYKGPWGILGHIKTDDVQKVLERNLEGLQLLNDKL